MFSIGVTEQQLEESFVGFLPYGRDGQNLIEACYTNGHFVSLVCNKITKQDVGSSSADYVLDKLIEWFAASSVADCSTD